MTDPFRELRAAVAALSTDELVELVRKDPDEVGRDLLQFILGELYVRRPDVLKATDEWAMSLDDERTQLQAVLDYLASE